MELKRQGLERYKRAQLGLRTKGCVVVWDGKRLQKLKGKLTLSLQQGSGGGIWFKRNEVLRTRERLGCPTHLRKES